MRIFYILLIVSVMLAATAQARDARVSVLKENGAAVGFLVQASRAERQEEVEVARVILGPAARWVAREVREVGAGERRGVELRHLDTAATGGTPALGDGSFVRLTTTPNEPYPRMEFRFEIQAFDPDKWYAALGQRAPLYFLLLPLQNARLWHVHGLLCPTPPEDPYPLTRPSIRGTWADGWSFGAALGSLTVPAVSLWDPAAGRLVGYEWAEARLTDKTTKYLGTAYCAGAPGFDQQFIALLSNYQKNWSDLTPPKPPLVVEGRACVIFANGLSDTKDANRLVLEHIYHDHHSLLPPAPAMNDLGWMVSRGTEELGKYGPSGGLFYVVPKDRWGWNEMFFDPDTVLYHGGFRGVDQMYKQRKEASIQRFETDLAEFLKHAQWKDIAGDRCCFWRYPLSGSWNKRMGGEPANTIHNVQQFSVGAAMLACYANTGRQDLLAYIDGLFNWARHYLFTRGDIADIPESMFTCQTSQVAIEFLMNYRRVFAKGDDEHRRRAEEALDLAHMVVYRNDNLTLGDPDETDDFEPGFMAPGNYNKFWLGQVSNAEICAVIRSLILLHVETGDSIFKWQARGGLERWWIGFKEDCWHTAENIDWFGESTGTKGKQTGIHDPCDNFWEWAQPVGGALMRVTCGAKAAMAFCSGTRALDVAEYAFAPEANLRFRIIRAGAGEVPESFDIVVSAPWRDLSQQAVSLNGRPLPKDRIQVLGTYSEHLYVRGVRIGDVIEVGQCGDARPMPPAPIPVAPVQPPQRKALGMTTVDLTAAAQDSSPRDWKSPEHFGGLLSGLAYAHGVPYWVIPAEANEGRWAVGPGGQAQIEGKAAFLFALSEKPHSLTVSTGDQTLRLSPEDGLLAVEGWPLCTWKLRLYPVPLQAGRATVRVEEGALLVAATTDPRSTSLAEALRDRIAQARNINATQAAHATNAVLEEARRRIEKSGRLQTPIAFIPPHGRTIETFTSAAQQMGVRTLTLLPQEFVDPAFFNPRRFPVAVYTGDERYLRTVKEKGDGERALLDYLRGGGFLLVAGACRPFSYAMDAKPDGTFEVVNKPWSLFGGKFELFLCGPGEVHRDAIGFEQPPPGVELTMRLTEKQDAFWDFPRTFPFLQTGDRRYRPLTAEGVAAEDEVVPILSTGSSDGKPYGPAVALTRHHCKAFNGARVLWAWGTLLLPPFEQRESVALQLLTYALTQSPAATEPLALGPPLPEAKLRVAVLPPDTWERDGLIKQACADIGATPVFLTPDQFVDPAFFNAKNFAAAIHAVGGERFLMTYRTPKDGENAYKRYLGEGGALIVCQNATPFHFEMLWEGGDWKARPPQRFWTMSFELGFESRQGFEKPEQTMSLELTDEGKRMWPDLPPRLPLDYLRDTRWRPVVTYRSGAARRFTPLAYVAQAPSPVPAQPRAAEPQGLAVAEVDFLESEMAGARVVCFWGNMVDGAVGRKLLAGCLRRVTAGPLEGTLRRSAE